MNFIIFPRSSVRFCCCRPFIFLINSSYPSHQQHIMPLLLSFQNTPLLTNILSTKPSLVEASIDDTSITSFAWSDFPVISQFHDGFLPVVVVESKICPSMTTVMPKMASSDDASSVSSDDWTVISEDDDDLSTCSAGTSSNSVAIKESSNKRRNVSFSPQLEIRPYKIIVGDHPDCPTLPLSLDWEHGETEIINLEEYERIRMRIRRRRPRKLLHYERKERLQEVSGLTC